MKHMTLKVVLGCLLSISGWPVLADDGSTGSSEEVVNARIVVNIPAREMTVYHHGDVIFRFPVAVGSAVYKTPVGPRFLTQVIWNPWWLPPNSPWAKGEVPAPPGPRNPLGPVKMELGDALRFHGTNNENTVGHAVSHGCMRMKNADAKTLAWWLQSHFSDQIDPLVLQKYAANPNTSFYVKLSSAIPVEIVYDLALVTPTELKIYPDVYGKFSNKEEIVRSILMTSGINPDEVNPDLFATILESSKKQTVAVTLKELLPGSIVSSKKNLSDPINEAWLKEAGVTPLNKQEFSLLFDVPSL